MNTWDFLKKEIAYFGIELIDSNKCAFKEDNKLIEISINDIISDINEDIKNYQEIFDALWKNIVYILNNDNSNNDNINLKNKRLFNNSIKQLKKFLEYFDILDYEIKGINKELFDVNISDFNKPQVDRVSESQISIDLIFRIIDRLFYLCNLLQLSMDGEEEINKKTISIKKVAAIGISGPWANLDLPMLERCYPFPESSLKGRMKDKQKQRRYEKWIYNYNNGGAVGEGHYWREIRNEPYSWYNREEESPYKHRALLNG